MTLQAGLNLGIYSIDGLIGRGSLGDVYRARDTRLNRIVALKLLSPLLANNPRHFARFDRAARTVAVINHPNIASVYDVGSYDGRPFVVSELLHGMNLRARMTGPISGEDAVGYALQIGCGLIAGHQVDVVHGDLRPENIFVTEGGRVKILDFGWGRCTLPAFEPRTNRPSRGTPSRMVRGPLAYLSPEQVRGESGDQRSDVFSVGVILYEMLTGTLPAEELAATSTPGMSPDLDRVIRNCIARNPESRYQSARDLVFGLELVDLAPRRAPGEEDAPRRWASHNMMWLT